MRALTSRIRALTSWQPPIHRLQARSFSPSAFRSKRQCRDILLPVGGSGFIRLALHHDPSTSHQQRPPILIILPQGPDLPFLQPQKPSAIHSIHGWEHPPTTIYINYRLLPPPLPSYNKATPPEERYPQPIHDVSTAFEFITSSLLSQLYPSLTSRPKICIHGQHIGGALAAILALTHPNSIHAIALEEPLLDWVALDQVAKSKNKPLAAAAKELIQMRTHFFNTPSAYFDPFASPTLFLRAPGRDTPNSHAEALGLIDAEGNIMASQADESEDEMGEDARMSGEDMDISAHDHEFAISELEATHAQRSASRSQLSSNVATKTGDAFGPYDDDLPHADVSSPPPRSTSADNSDSGYDSPSTRETPTTTRPIRRRKVLRRWPPVGRPEDVLLPYLKVFVPPPPSAPTRTSAAQAHAPSSTADNATTAQQHEEHDGMKALLRIQGVEFADLVRRACFFGQQGEDVAGRRVQLGDAGNRSTAGDGDAEATRANGDGDGDVSAWLKRHMEPDPELTDG